MYVPLCDFFFLLQLKPVGCPCACFWIPTIGTVFVFGDTLHWLGQSKEKRTLLPTLKAERGRTYPRLNKLNASIWDFEEIKGKIQGHLKIISLRVKNLAVVGIVPSKAATQPYRPFLWLVYDVCSAASSPLIPPGF